MNLQLPVDLNERRNVLENELKKVITELCFTDLRKELNELFAEYSVEPRPTSISWEFYGEYDDEGGTNYRPRNITVYVNEEVLDCEDIMINKKSKWSDDYYDFYLEERIYDIINDCRDELYEYDIEEIEL